MKKVNNGIKFSVGSLLVIVGVIAAIAIGIFFLSKTSLFDKSGGYIKGMAGNNDVMTIMNTAEVPSYLDMLDENTDEFENKPLKFYGSIASKEVNNDKTAEYVMIVTVNKKDAVKLDKSYPRQSDKTALAPIIFKTTKDYNDFMVGDYIWMYGEFEEIVETKEHDKVPYIKAKTLVLDSEVTD